MNDILESKIYKDFREYNSTAKLKPFWKAFEEFIEDRNKYTHGHLCIHKPTFEYLIEYIDSETNKHKYAHISKDILISYNNCYRAIRNVITQYNVIYQDRLLGKVRKENIT